MKSRLVLVLAGIVVTAVWVQQRGEPATLIRSGAVGPVGADAGAVIDEIESLRARSEEAVEAMAQGEMVACMARMGFEYVPPAVGDSDFRASNAPAISALPVSSRVEWDRALLGPPRPQSALASADAAEVGCWDAGYAVVLGEQGVTDQWALSEGLAAARQSALQLPASPQIVSSAPSCFSGLESPTPAEMASHISAVASGGESVDVTCTDAAESAAKQAKESATASFVRDNIELVERVHDMYSALAEG